MTINDLFRAPRVAEFLLDGLRLFAREFASLAGSDAARAELHALADSVSAPPKARRGRPPKGTTASDLNETVKLMLLLDAGEKLAGLGKLPRGVNPRGWKLHLARGLASPNEGCSEGTVRQRLKRADRLRRKLAEAPPSRLLALARMGSDRGKK